MYSGELFGVLTALAWAIGSLFFSSVRVSAQALNLFKNTLGSLLLIGTLSFLAWRGGTTLIHWDGATWGYLIASAVVGLVIGDTCYFRSLQILGPRRALVMTVLAPPAALLLGWTLLGETMGGMALVGIAVTLVGVLWVILERGAARESAGHFPASAWKGVVLGGIGALCQAIGAIWTKQGIQSLQALDAAHPSMEASFMRLIAASTIGLAVALMTRRLREWGRQVKAPGVLPRLIPGSFCGTYLGIWFSLLSFQLTTVGVATTLHSTSTIFVIPLVWIFLRQKVTFRALAGAGIAVAGVILLFQD